MKKLLYLVLVIAAIASCGKKKEPQKEAEMSISTEVNVDGDSTVYGLACDGCTDTILVFLPRSGGDPDTFNILNASRRQHVFGHPMIGDRMAVVINPENPKVADLVIDLEELNGEWCYQVMPRLKERAGMTEAIKREMLADSAIQQLMQPREYGFQIKSDYTARPIGSVYRTMSNDDESPIEYPTLKRYREWHIFNGRLVLNETTRDSLGNQVVTGRDTAEFVLMRRDTLVLRFADGERGYYRKEEPKEKDK